MDYKGFLTQRDTTQLSTYYTSSKHAHEHQNYFSIKPYIHKRIYLSRVSVGANGHVASQITCKTP